MNAADSIVSSIQPTEFVTGGEGNLVFVAIISLAS
jgi:hypothetical protein